MTTRGERRTERRFLRELRQARRREVHRPRAPDFTREELARIARSDLDFRLDVLGLFLENRSSQVVTIAALQNATNPGT
jgi:hypothetical protein